MKAAPKEDWEYQKWRSEELCSFQDPLDMLCDPLEQYIASNDNVRSLMDFEES